MTVKELIEQLQSAELDLSKHRVLVWDFGAARPIDCEISIEDDDEGEEVVVLQPTPEAQAAG